jgi:hypothetical protein
VTFVVPEGSGSEAFIRKVFAAEPSLAGVEPNFRYASGQDAILAAVKGTRGAVGVFYAYPNPTTHDQRGYGRRHVHHGNFVTAVARGSSDFYLTAERPTTLSWFGLGETKTERAMCSKALLFSGDRRGLKTPGRRADYEEFIAKLRALPADALCRRTGRSPASCAKWRGSLKSMA